MSDQDRNVGTPADDEWGPCAAGELQRMVARDRSSRRNRTLTKAVSAGAVCLVLLGGVVLTSQRQPVEEAVPVGNGLAGISCGAVYFQLGSYIAGDLDAAKSEQIRQHLELCPKCRRSYEQMAAKPVVFNAGTCTDPTCRHCQPLQHPQVRLAGQPDHTADTLAMN